MAVLRRTRRKTGTSTEPISVRSLGSKLKASISGIDQIVALYERERRERIALLAENARLKKIVDRVQSAVGADGLATTPQIVQPRVAGLRAQPGRRKRKPLSPEARAKAAQNLVKARAARASKLAATKPTATRRRRASAAA